MPTVEIHDLSRMAQPFAQPTALALGYFDAFHRGHIALLRIAAQTQFIPAMFTFSGDFYGALGLPYKNIYSESVRMQLAADCRVRHVFTLPADTTHLALSSAVFLQLLLRANPRCVVCGEDFRFGHGATGDVAMLARFCSDNDILCLSQPFETDCDGCKISTRLVRECLAQGDMERAHALLGRPYTLQGVVVRGRGQGHGLGFPTANVDLDPALQPPAYGVYVATVHVARPGQHYALCHIGPHPTLGDNHANVECYLLNESMTLYGETIEVGLLTRLRDIVQFATPEALTQQIRADCAAALAYIGGIHD